MPLTNSIQQVKTLQSWPIGKYIVIFEESFEDTDYDFIVGAPDVSIVVTGTVALGTKTRSSIEIESGDSTVDGYYIATGRAALTTFFTPLGSENTGWVDYNDVVQLIDPTNKIISGFASTDIPNSQFIFKDGIFVSIAAAATLYGQFSIDGSYLNIKSGTTGAIPARSIAFNVAGTQIVTISRYGLGINVVNPAIPLHLRVASDAWSMYSERSGGSQFGIFHFTSPRVYTQIGNSSSHDLKITAGNASIMLLQSGEVRIGTGNTGAFFFDVQSQGPGSIAQFHYAGGTSGLEIGINANYAWINGYLGLTLAVNTAFVYLKEITGVQYFSLFTDSPTKQFDVDAESRFRQNVYLATGASQKVAVGTQTLSSETFYVFGSSRITGVTYFQSDVYMTNSMSKLVIYSLLVGASSSTEYSAIAEFVSTTKGILPPKMTTTQRDAINSPAIGLVVFNTTTNKINVRGSTAWEVVTSA